MRYSSIPRDSRENSVVSGAPQHPSSEAVVGSGEEDSPTATGCAGGCRSRSLCSTRTLPNEYRNRRLHKSPDGGLSYQSLTLGTGPGSGRCSLAASGAVGGQFLRKGPGRSSEGKAGVAAGRHMAVAPAGVSASQKAASLPMHSRGGGGGGGASADSNTIMNSTSVPPEDLASQLTLLDLPVFRSIAPEELMSCSWNKKNKLEVAPNVVAFTRRFNHVSFWTVQEVLRYEAVKARAEVMAHFIRVAKKLGDLNNFHSQMAILSALQSAPLFRLSKTWAQLPRKERATFDRLVDLFSENNNFASLREHMNSNALKQHTACIPYLGLYLTDLTFVDLAHPHSGGLETQQRQFKMNNILRIVSELQQSSYANLSVIPQVQQYLRSIRYIDELQRFIEDDHYKLSLKLEPNSPAASSSSSKESIRSNSARIQQQQQPPPKDPSLVAELNLSPAEGSGCIRTPATKQSFVPGHRKSRSEGGNIFWACGGRAPATALAAAAGNEAVSWSGGPEAAPGSDEKVKLHLLDDSLILEDSTAGVCSSSGVPVPGQSLKSSPAGSIFHSDKLRLTSNGNGGGRQVGADPRNAVATNADQPGTTCNYQGCVKRKTLIKEGRRPTMTAWQRYWLQLWGSSLVFFAPKTLTKGIERRDYRSEPCKYQSIEAWLVTAHGCSADAHMDELTFQMTDPFRKNIYRFRAPSPEDATGWCAALQDGVSSWRTKLPDNLIEFEEEQQQHII